MDCSLFSPIPNLPWYLYPVWPLIFWRIQCVKAWFRRAGGPGSQMLWGVDRWGRVVILSLSDDLSGCTPAPEPFTVHLSCRFRAALSGEDPCSNPFRSSRRTPGPSNWLQFFTALVPGVGRDERAMELPLPET